jgi:hypothetical protein
MIAILLAGLVFVLLCAAAKRTGVKGVPANKKPNTDPFELQRERSMERSSAEIEHERDNTPAHSNCLKKDERAKSSFTQEDFLAFQRLLHPDLHEHLREQEAKAKKKSFEEQLREATAGIKVPARDLSRDLAGRATWRGNCSGLPAAGCEQPVEIRGRPLFI